MADVFISHVEEDANLVLEIARWLEEAGYTAWYYERDGIPGPSYLIQTSRAIEECHAFLLVISKESLGSHQITKEVVRAHESAKPFIPLLVNVTHVEFQNRQPEWREAVGAATSIGLSGRKREDVLGGLTRGLRSLGIEPSGRRDVVSFSETAPRSPTIRGATDAQSAISLEDRPDNAVRVTAVGSQTIDVSSIAFNFAWEGRRIMVTRSTGESTTVLVSDLRSLTVVPKQPEHGSNVYVEIETLAGHKIKGHPGVNAWIQFPVPDSLSEEELAKMFVAEGSHPPSFLVAGREMYANVPLETVRKIALPLSDASKVTPWKTS